MTFRTSTCLAGIAALTLPLAGCVDLNGTERAATGPIVAVVVDQSCDASGELNRAARIVTEKAVRFAAAQRGTFLATPVTTETYQTRAFAVRHDFTTTKKNEVQRQRDLNGQASDFLKNPEVAALGAGHQSGSCGSDLLGIPAAVSRAVVPLAEKGQRPVTVVVVTNGLVVQGAHEFLHDPLDPAAVKAIIGDVQGEGLLPRLAGVRVELVGLGLDPRIPASQTRAVEQFWRAFLEATEADVHLNPISDGISFAGGSE